MNIYAFTIGIAIVAYIIIRFKKTRLERTKWAYPVLLATFPCYYFAFAIYAKDTQALGLEILTGLAFFLIAFFSYKSSKKASALLVGLGCIIHGFYDVYHDLLFINSGTPEWWLEFCGSIDFILGVYLIYYAIKAPNKSINYAPSAPDS
ncbi:hypothetical protein ACJJI4_01360 [Microbulbifer sp. TRSA002]|uniref:hypothetical protein n=1 Tax=Microbulbifer sp. TRSA002 TaxID=3243382 RepID=UPI004039F886